MPTQMLTTKKERVGWLDSAKAFAIILVVVGHVFGGYTGKYAIQEYQGIIDYVVWLIYTFHMPLFFMISGFIFGIGKKQIRNKTEYLYFVRKKAKSLMIPYYIFATQQILVKLPLQGKISSELSFTNILLLPIIPVDQYWFLYVLFLCFSLHSFLNWKNKNNIVIPIVMMIISFIVSAFGSETILKYGTIIISFFKQYFYFWIGEKLAKNNYKLSKKEFVICLFVFAVLSTIIYFYSNFNNLLLCMLRVILGLSGSFTILFICKNVSSISKSNILHYIGSHTMIIYIVHVLLCAIIRIGLYKIGVNNFLLHIIIGTVFSIVIPIIMEQVIKKVFIRKKLE